MSRNILPQKRRRSREIALQVLYALDIRNCDSVDQILDFYPGDDEEPDVVSYATVLVKGVWDSRFEIDTLIREHVVGWRPERMVAVDRAALRLAIFEGIIKQMIPIPVAISEAVELAKAFGTEESGRFVNGVLGRIVRALSLAEKDENHVGDDSPHSHS
ncbi:MAG TPA: transcription antitermination factor NusB [Aminobacterium sp.]|uniref:transcription antitermination factor NusB n=1 Tax=Aminobacterium TaxID=81466 RepID=UPI000465CA1F|nr:MULTISPECIES: transcription antitermination factor NusB [Aminobacterium]HCA40713.1 transcription antitermination factor NusB [Aminobacterium sp.]